ncbi:MAG: redox-regulated ATPase YchF [Candidatus Pacebacteria bacterium]|nr:redox-regulated ATPase YchF [Candidatus Paceibacterota bacterium]MDD3919022.1 redox-regulated ATPase YchF [Candidatus Paceibacterota bacterium]
MSLHIGIVGFPNVGKSTLFKAITKKQVDCANYPFCTIDPNVGVAAVPDRRVDLLAELMNSKKKIYTTIEFVDIAGLVEGANKGEGLGNQFLANIREVDAVLYVLRCFKDSNIASTREEINPIKDKEILDMEMALKDLSTVEKRIEGVQKKTRSGVKKEDEKELELLNKIKTFLEEGKVLIDQDFSLEEKEILKQYQLLTFKKRVYLLNGSNEEVGSDIKKQFEERSWNYLVINIKEEIDADGLSDEERKELGLPESKLNLLIEKCYEVLGLITFLTTGEDETRAWTLEKGALAPDAGGVIHTDFKDKFIKAEIINWEDLYNSKTFGEARGKGLIRTEGKEYVVKDGDVIEIKSNA